MSSVSIIIPNYNNSKYIAECLRAVLANNPHEIIVVDDASTDDSVEIIKTFPVTLIQNEKNLGPVKARNIGAKHATGEYLLFLDGDAAMDELYSSKLANFLDTYPKTGVVSGKIVEGMTGDRMWYNFGYDPDFIKEGITRIIHPAVLKWWNNPSVRKFITRIATPFTLNLVPDAQRKVDWVIEMAFMTRRSVFEKLGGLDERFFIFYEGPDYCRRVRKAGFEVWYTPEAATTHLGGHSHPTTRNRHFRESRIKYFKKYLFSH